MHSADGNLGGKVTIWIFYALSLCVWCVCVYVSGSGLCVFLSFIDNIICLKDGGCSVLELCMHEFYPNRKPALAETCMFCFALPE